MTAPTSNRHRSDNDPNTDSQDGNDSQSLPSTSVFGSGSKLSSAGSTSRTPALTGLDRPACSALLDVFEPVGGGEMTAGGKQDGRAQAVPKRSHNTDLKARVRWAKSVFVAADAKLLKAKVDVGVHRGTYDLLLTTLVKKLEANENSVKDGSVALLPGACNIFFVLPKTKNASNKSGVQADGVDHKGDFRSLPVWFGNDLMLECVRRAVNAFNRCQNVVATPDLDVSKLPLHPGTQRILSGEFPGMLRWRVEVMQSRNREVLPTHQALLRDDPMFRLLHELGKTRAASPSRKAYRIDMERIEFELRKIRGMDLTGFRKKRARSGKNARNEGSDFPPDAVLAALLKGFSDKMWIAVKEILTSNREKVVSHLFKQVAARVYACQMFPEDPGYVVMTPSRKDVTGSEESGGESSHTLSRLNAVPKTKSYAQRDSVGNLRRLPYSRSTLEILVSVRDITENRRAFAQLKALFPHFVVTTNSRQYRYSPERGAPAWESRDFNAVAAEAEAAVEEWTTGGESPVYELVDKLPVSCHRAVQENLHDLALNVLMVQAGFNLADYTTSRDIFLAARETSLQAVHALALTFYGVFRKIAGHPLETEERIHCGPVNLFYDTDGEDARKGNVGLVGVRCKPETLRTNVDKPLPQIGRANDALPPSTFKIVRDEVFILESNFKHNKKEGVLYLEDDPAWKGHPPSRTAASGGDDNEDRGNPGDEGRQDNGADVEESSEDEDCLVLDNL